MSKTYIADRYEVIDRLGKGGMGTVYRARDRRLVRDVALKVLDFDEALGDEQLYYFQREARAAAALQHPGIVQIFDFSGPDERPPFIVMELVKGQTLHEMMNEFHPLHEYVIIALLHETAAAVAHAHEHGVIHRDLKPNNILLDAKGRVALTDFGLAKAYQEPNKLGGTVAGRQTEVFGTPGFLSPEQVLSGESGPESDVFALGCLAYCLAVGQSPFASDDPVESMRRIADVDYEPLLEVRSDVSAGLAGIVEKCLTADLLDRVEAQELVADCRAALFAQGLPDPRSCVAGFLQGQHPKQAASPPAIEQITPRDRVEMRTKRSSIPSASAPAEATSVEAFEMAGAFDDHPQSAADSDDGDKTEVGEHTALSSHGASSDLASGWGTMTEAEVTGIEGHSPTYSADVTHVTDATVTEIASGVSLDSREPGIAVAKTTENSAALRRPLWVGASVLGGVAVLSVIAWFVFFPGSPTSAVETSSATLAVDRADSLMSPPSVPSPKMGSIVDNPRVKPAAGENAEVATAEEPPRGAESDRVQADEFGSTKKTIKAENDNSSARPSRTRSKDRRSTPAANQRQSSKTRTAHVTPKILKIAVNPWGVIILDGKKIGNAPRVRQVTAAPGKHTVTVKHPPSGRTITRQVMFGRDNFMLFDFDDE